jgi:methane/ammonia monooxygenase subunit B
MRKKIVLGLLIQVAVLVLLAPAASAHGERAQEAFLKARTVGWINTHFEPGEGAEVREGESGEDEIFIGQGEMVTVSGTTTLMESWPGTLAGGDPRTGFINLISPGPVITIREKSINGVSAPHRIEIQKGGIYEYEIVFAGRTPGRWHVHPSFSVKGAGTLLGPGMWINVEAVDGYENNIELAAGGTINLESYGTTFVWIFSTITFVIGMGWMFYWTLRKRTVQNLAVTSQIPLNTDGMSVGLITKADHRNMNLFLIVTVALTVGMFIYQAVAWPDKLPQQVIEFAPPVAEQPGSPPDAIGTRAEFNSDGDVMTLTARVTNTGESDIELSEFTISTLTFTNPDVAEAPPGGAELSVEPSATVEGGATEELTLTLADPRWEDDQLIPTAESQFEIAGLLVFDDGTWAEVHAPLIVQF